MRANGLAKFGVSRLGAYNWRLGGYKWQLAASGWWPPAPGAEVGHGRSWATQRAFTEVEHKWACPEQQMVVKQAPGANVGKDRVTSVGGHGTVEAQLAHGLDTKLCQAGHRLASATKWFDRPDEANFAGGSHEELEDRELRRVPPEERS